MKNSAKWRTEFFLERKDFWICRRPVPSAKDILSRVNDSVAEFRNQTASVSIVSSQSIEHVEKREKQKKPNIPKQNL